MASWEPLGAAEKELHELRLMGVEKKAFTRLTDQVKSTASLISTALSNGSTNEKADFDVFREGVTLDFASFDNSLLRLQFHHDANIRERERYHVNQERIQEETQSARANNAELREQLEEARATLAQRKKFDEMADKITSNRMLRPREEQAHNLKKLEDECRELERESNLYEVVWRERRDQFNKIMEEGMLLRRQIRDEKEEVDRREGMDEGDDDDAAAGTPRPDASRSGTPAPDGEGQGVKTDGETPRPLGSAAPTPAAQDDGEQLSVAGHRRSASRSRRPSQEKSPQATLKKPSGAQPVEDEVMDDGEEDSRNATDVATPSVVIDAPEGQADKMDVDN